jgi:hypothetical protein
MQLKKISPYCYEIPRSGIHERAGPRVHEQP